jgi:antitoxin (DNA-binding transcriptional repressor) of toxin-antitoxin stability system
MPKTLTVTEMARSFADYINRVAYRKESFVLTRGNKPIAELRPIKRGITGQELIEIFKDGPHLHPDDIEQFAKDVEEAREELNRIGIRDPWED